MIFMQKNLIIYRKEFTLEVLVVVVMVNRKSSIDLYTHGHNVFYKKISNEEEETEESK